MKTEIIDWLNDVIDSRFVRYDAPVKKMYANSEAGLSSDGYRIHIHNGDMLPSDSDEFIAKFEQMMANGDSKGSMLISSKYLLDALSVFNGNIHLEIIEVEAKEGPGNVLRVSSDNDNVAIIMALAEKDEDE